MSAALAPDITSRKAGASTVRQFCSDNGIGRTKFYDEVNAGRLRAVKSGGRTLVLDEDAEAWRRALPAVCVRTPETQTAERS
ncbi:hypothetical protein [Enterovirga sp. CN4-39]|uniref:hypothetical protein n=1 Tax=Enterovirga sp. CN4-39 TaxID=3400910 RepID=UPI003C0553DA